MKIELDITKMFNDDRMVELYRTDPYINNFYNTLITSNLSYEEIFIMFMKNLSTARQCIQKDYENYIVSNPNVKVIK